MIENLWFQLYGFTFSGLGLDRLFSLVLKIKLSSERRGERGNKVSWGSEAAQTRSLEIGLHARNAFNCRNILQNAILPFPFMQSSLS